MRVIWHCDLILHRLFACQHAVWYRIVLYLPYQDVFVLVVAGEFEVAGGRQDRLDGSHAVVVVELRAQLLRTQPIRRHDLDGHEGSRLPISVPQ